MTRLLVERWSSATRSWVPAFAKRTQAGAEALRDAMHRMTGATYRVRPDGCDHDPPCADTR